MDIPHAKDLAERPEKASLQTLAAHKEKLAHDVAKNSATRLTELRDHVAQRLHHASGISIEVVVAESPISYPPGSTAITQLTDFGSHHV